MHAMTNQQGNTASADRGNLRDSTHEELRLALLSAMQLAINKVPGYAHSGLTYTCTERPYVEELMNTLDHVEPLEQFLRVLKDSSCPMVAKLRVTLADVYARTTVDGVIAARGSA